jgi:deoxyribodipyrimidine photolyase-related protein
MKNRIGLVFPHQLFKASPLFKDKTTIYLVEEFLFFKQYSFHQQKIAFHRATMKAYEAYLKSKKIEVVYIEATAEISDIRILIPELKQRGVDHIDFIDPVDNWLHKRLNTACDTCAIAMTRFDSPMFLNNKDELAAFFRTDKKKYHQTSFYTEQRKKRKVLIESDGKPAGGKWTFDTENRKKYPAKKTPPSVQFPDIDDYYIEDLCKSAFFRPFGKAYRALFVSDKFSDHRNLVSGIFRTTFHRFWGL